MIKNVLDKRFYLLSKTLLSIVQGKVESNTVF